TTFPERPVAAIALSHPGPLLGQGSDNRRLDAGHRPEAVEVIEMPVDDLVGALRDFAWGRKRVAVVAQHVDGKVRPWANAAPLTAVSVEQVQLARGRARDNDGLPMSSDGIVGNLRIRRVDVQHGDITAPAGDEAEGVG